MKNDNNATISNDKSVIPSEYIVDHFEKYPNKAPSISMQEVLDRLTAIEKSVKNLSKRYTWEDQTSETGIQLQSSTATITRKGVLIAAAPIPVGPNQMTLGFILQDENGKIHLLPADHVKQVQD